MYMDTELQAYISSLHYDVPVGDEGKNNAYDEIDNKLRLSPKFILVFFLI